MSSSMRDRGVAVAGCFFVEHVFLLETWKDDGEYQMGWGRASRDLLKVLRLACVKTRPAVTGFRYAGIRTWSGSTIWPVLLKEGTDRSTTLNLITLPLKGSVSVYRQEI